MLFISLKYCPDSLQQPGHHEVHRITTYHVGDDSRGFAPYPPFQGLNPPHNPSISIDARHEQQRQSRPSPQRNLPLLSLRFDRSSPHERRLSSLVSKNWPGRERLSCVTDYHSSRARHSYLLLHSVAIWSGRLVLEADGGSCWRKSNSVYITQSR
jgi:hypothetical protein